MNWMKALNFELRSYNRQGVVRETYRLEIPDHMPSLSGKPRDIEEQWKLIKQALKQFKIPKQKQTTKESGTVDNIKNTGHH